METSSLLIFGFIFFAITLIFALLTNHLLLKVIRKLGLDQNNTRQNNLVRWAAQTKPAVGGFSFFIVFLFSVASYFIFPLQSIEQIFNLELFALLATTTIGFTIGLIDDSYTMPPFFKFIGQLVCAIIMIGVGIYIPISGYYLLDGLFTIFWVVGIMNSVNMLDNMDGITTSVSVCIVLGTIMLAILSGGIVSYFYVFMLLGSVSALLGFLYFNWHPSKMFMGDTGSQFLGALLSFISILFMWKYTPTQETTSSFSIQQFLLPITLFLMPIIDTTTVSIRRLARGQSPFLGGRDHTTHHLAYCGLKDNQVGWVFISLSLISVAVAYWIATSFATWTWYHSFGIILYWIGIFLGIQWFYEKGKKKHEKRRATTKLRVLSLPNQQKQAN